MQALNNSHTGSAALYLRVRAGFVSKGTNLHRWCVENGVSRQAAEKALKGQRNGPKAIELRQSLAAASGVLS